MLLLCVKNIPTDTVRVHASQALIEWCADNIPDIPVAEMSKDATVYA